MCVCVCFFFFFFFFFCLVFSEKIRLAISSESSVCLADDTHEMPSLFSRSWRILVGQKVFQNYDAFNILQKDVFHLGFYFLDGKI